MDFNHPSGSIQQVSELVPTSGTITVNSTGSLVLPTGSTAQRPASPAVGATRFNTTLVKQETWNGSSWLSGLGSIDDCADVTITSPISGNLTYNGTQWVNSVAAPSAFSVIISSWAADGPGFYYADVTHNIGTQNISVELWNSATNELIAADRIVATSTNVVRIYVTDTTHTIRCVVMANGLSIAAGASTPSSVIIQQNGVGIANNPHPIVNFTGTGVSVTDSGGGAATVHVSTLDILRTLTFYSNSMDSPNTADWAVNALAASVTDPTYSALSVRQFSNTSEQGIGVLWTVPTGATNITFRFKGRAQTAPSGTSVVQPKLYIRAIPHNAAVGSWSTAYAMSNITIPPNALFQYSSQTFTLTSLGLTVGTLYQSEITRSTTVTGGTNLSSNWYLAELTIEFS